jgi:transposase-like protein
MITIQTTFWRVVAMGDSQTRRNARAKGKHIGRRPHTFLSPEMREAIARAYRRREGSLRELASRFGTSVGTVQRCLRAYQTGATESPRPPGS